MGQRRIHHHTGQTPRIAEAHPKRAVFIRVLGIEHPTIKTLIIGSGSIRQPDDGFVISHHHSSGHAEVNSHGHALGFNQHHFAVTAYRRYRSA